MTCYMSPYLKLHATLSWKRVGKQWSWTAECTRKVEIRNVEFLAVGKADKAMFWPSPEFTEGIYYSFEFSLEGDLNFFTDCNTLWSGQKESSNWPCAWGTAPEGWRSPWHSSSPPAWSVSFWLLLWRQWPSPSHLQHPLQTWCCALNSVWSPAQIQDMVHLKERSPPEKNNNNKKTHTNKETKRCSTGVMSRPEAWGDKTI